MGSGILAVLAISSAFFIFCLTRGQKMREEKRVWPELCWYAGGLFPITAITLAWTAMENQAMPQRILLVFLGAIIGGLAFYALGELLRPIAPAIAQGGQPVSGGKNSVTISGSNNTVTIGHIGDVNVPGPELRLSSAERKTNADGTFTSIFDAQVMAPYTPGSLRVEAWAPNIRSLEVAPQRTGVSMGGPGGVRPDHAFATVMSPFGRYKIIVVTPQQTDVEIKYAFDQ